MILIMMILTMAKFSRNLLKESTLSLCDIANTFSPLGSLYNSKMPLVNFFSGHTLPPTGNGTNLTPLRQLRKKWMELMVSLNGDSKELTPLCQLREK